jgi:hypothetical protein
MGIDLGIKHASVLASLLERARETSEPTIELFVL